MHHMRSFYFWIVTVISLGTVYAAEPITARDATIDNVQLHYLTAGHGPATVILLHGFAETSRMWRPIIPQARGKVHCHCAGFAGDRRLIDSGQDRHVGSGEENPCARPLVEDR
jgi:hypothetical protein